MVRRFFFGALTALTLVTAFMVAQPASAAPKFSTVPVQVANRCFFCNCGDNGCDCYDLGEC